MKKGDLTKKCFVYQKRSYMSFNYSPKERRRTTSTIRRTFRQYIAKLDIEDNSEIDNTNDPFDVLLTSRIDFELELDLEPKLANIHFTTYGIVDIEHSMEITTLLANQAYAYALTSANTHRDRREKKKHRYLDNQFIGVLIDTKATCVSTTSTRQF